MRCVLLGLVVAASTSAWAGPIADQYRSGYDGVRWGLSLANVVGMMSEGEHYFAHVSGQRDYAVTNDAPLLGVPRPGTRVRYYFGKDDGVITIAIGIPYDRYQQMLGALISQFGRYAQAKDVGAVTYYMWKEDEQIRLDLRVTKEPRYGIAEVVIKRVPDAMPKVGSR